MRVETCPTLRRGLLAGLLSLLAGCASLPADPVERGLYLDLRRAVELSEDTQWIADASQLDDNFEDALRSVCQVAPAHRANLSAWIGGQLLLQGGTPQQIYRDNDRDLGAASEALTLDRVRKMLEYAHGRAAAECPFWLSPREDFRGVQAGGERPVVWLESIGAGRAILRNGKVGLGGGGGGRLLLGYAFNHRVTLVGGLELGGGGVIESRNGGGDTIVTAFSGAAPLLLRINGASRLLDLELAPVFPLLESSPDNTLGLRASIGGGLGTMRKADFMPYIVIFAGYEVHPATRDAPRSHIVMVGSRVGLDWMPW